MLMAPCCLVVGSLFDCMATGLIPDPGGQDQLTRFVRLSSDDHVLLHTFRNRCIVPFLSIPLTSVLKVFTVTQPVFSSLTPSRFIHE